MLTSRVKNWKEPLKNLLITTLLITNLQHVLLVDVAFVFNDVLCVSLIIKSARETGKNYDIVLTCEQT